MNKADIKNTQWVNYGRWTQPTISGAFWTHWDEAECAKALGDDAPLPKILFLDGYHLTPAAEDAAVKAFFEQSYKGGTLGEIYERFEAASAKSEQRILALKDMQDASNPEYITELFAAFLEIIGIWSFMFRFSSSLEEVAREQGLAATDDEMLAKMRPYARTTWLERQTLEVKALARALRAAGIDGSGTLTAETIRAVDPALFDKVAAHVGEFSWFGTHHWEGAPYSLEKCLADMQDVLAKDADAQSQHAESPSNDDNIVWKLLASFAYWRTHCAELSDKAAYDARGRFTEVAQGWGLTYGDLVWLSSGEILTALRASETSIALPENFAERKNGYGCYIDEGQEYIFVGAELHELIDITVPKTDDAVTSVKGTVASKGGIITGRAQVIMGPGDFARFNEGDILVANETTPDFVPLMKKASAIVTDTGGITSHAAIVSRELRKPCVIGTKNATKVFKTGDMVEVDAQTGIIRKI